MAGSFRRRTPAHAARLALLILGTTLATGVHAAPLCPAPVSPTDGAPARTGPRQPPSTPAGRELLSADQRAAAGDIAGARRIYERLARGPADRVDVPGRARIRLVNLLLTEDRYTEAEAAATAALPRARTPADRARLLYYRDSARYRLGLEATADAVEAADLLADAEAWPQAEAAYARLLERPCPVRDDHRERMQLRLAAIALAQEDFALARTRAGAIDRGDPDIAAQVAAFLGRVDQRERDKRVRDEIDLARAEVEAQDNAAAFARLSTIEARLPGATPSLYASARLQAADVLSRQGQFGAARAWAASAVIAPDDTALVTRRTDIEARIAERETAARARGELEAAQALVQAGEFTAAQAKLDTLADPAGPWPAEWQQSARLRKASAYRVQGDYVAARREVASVAAAPPVNDQLVERVATERSRIDEATPLHRFRGAVLAGVAYDTNAGVRTAASPDDAFVVAPVDEKDDDGVFNLQGSVDYRLRLSDRNDQLRIAARGLVAEQFTLSPLDRLEWGASAGGVFRIPSIGGSFEAGASYDYSRRGDSKLYDEQGGYAALAWRMNDWNGALSYEGAWRDDVRPGFDGWRQRLRVTLSERAASGWTLLWGLRDNDADRRDLRYRSVEAGAGYNWDLSDRLALPLSFDLVGYGEMLDYRAASPDVQGRDDLRLRIIAGAELPVTASASLRFEFEQLNILSDVTRDRDNQRFSLSVRQRF